MELESRGAEWRAPVIGQGASHCQAIASNDLCLPIFSLFERSLNRAYSANMLLQFLFGVPIRFIDGLRRLAEVVKVT